MKSFNISAIVLIINVLFLVSCVTTNNAEGFHKEKALQSRIAAGAAYLQANNLFRAREHTMRALEIDKNSGKALTLLALIYVQEQDYVSAEEQFKKAVKQKSGQSQAYNNYGVMLYDIGRYEDAVMAFESAASDDAYSQRASALNNVGRCYKELGDYDKALAAWRQALRINHYEPTANLAMSQYYFEQKDYKQANKYFSFFEKADSQNKESALLGLRLAEKSGDATKIKFYQELWLEASKEDK